MNLRFLLLLFCIPFCGNQLLSAQDQTGFRVLSVKEGLSQNSVISVTQDSTGYLWLATQDGLNKYDGRNFTKYPFLFEDVTRPDFSYLGKTYVDRKGQVWCIPTSRQLFLYTPEKDTFNVIEGLSNASVLLQEDDQTYWVGTYGDGLIRMRYKNGEYIVDETLLAGTTIFDIKEHQEELLIASDKGILVLPKNRDGTPVVLNTTSDQSPIPHKFSTVSLEPAYDRQWFGTFGGGLYYRNGKESQLHAVNELNLNIPIPSNLNILSLWTDRQHQLWIGTYGRGLYRIDLKTNQSAHFLPDKYNPKAIHYNDILCIYEDYTGTIWFGTDGAGISYYDAYLEKFNSLTNLQVPENINLEVIRSVETHPDGSLWLGTSGKGLNRYFPQTNSWVKYSSELSGLLSNRIMSLHADDAGTMWVGTQGGGLSFIDADGKLTNYLNNESLPLKVVTIWDIHEDNKGRTWLATRENGIVQFDKKEGKIREHNASNTDYFTNNVRVITDGSGGVLWLGTELDGIIRYHPESGVAEKFVLQSRDGSKKADKIKSLYYAENHVLWIGTNGDGLVRFDTLSGEAEFFGMEDGLANNVVYSILSDNAGHLWLSSNFGITRFTPGEGDKAPETINYTHYEGLATEFNTGGGHKAADGALYFGGLEGVYWFRPEQIRVNNQLPKTVITDLQVANESKPVLDGLKLSPKENTLTFTFSSMQFSLPEKNQYRYRLEDYDQDWIEAGNTNFARYSYLPSGDYIFKVQSSNYDGIWNPETATLNFTIASPWYATLWAKFFYVLTLLMAVILTYSYFKWRWKLKLDLKLKEEEADRLKKLNKFKTRLYTDISHEFRTPLTLIEGPVDAKLEEGNLNDADLGYFSMIKRNTRRLLALVNQLLDLGKLETGRVHLQPIEENLGQFLRLLAGSFEQQAQRREIGYQWNVTGLDTCWYDEDAIEKIITNLLSNAMKYGNSGGGCHLEATASGGNMELVVRNTINPDQEVDLEKLFTRFYQKDAYTEGVGVGLALVKELIGLYQGDIQVKLDEATHEISFFVKLPVVRRLLEENPNVDFEAVINSSLQPNNLSEVFALENGVEGADKANSDLPIVLIVEDNVEVREFLKNYWRNRFRIFEAADGSSGLDVALEVVPDLIVTDIHMPGISGIKLCNKLKQDERTSHIPIIILTASTDELNELKGLKSGADAFVTKPFKLKLLNQRVENLIASRKALQDRYNKSSVLQAQEIAINTVDEKFIARVDKVLVKRLSDPEFGASEFCREIGMSRMQLHRKLQAYTGLSTSAFIRSQRLKNSLNLLQKGNLTINEIAYAVGFNTPSYFIKCFKETYHSTPTEYLSKV